VASEEELVLLTREEALGLKEMLNVIFYFLWGDCVRVVLVVVTGVLVVLLVCVVGAIVQAGQEAVDRAEAWRAQRSATLVGTQRGGCRGGSTRSRPSRRRVRRPPQGDAEDIAILAGGQ